MQHGISVRVLVDEYQDTNRLQASILLAPKPTRKGLTVVGDYAQSIDAYVATGRARDAVAGTAKDEAVSAPSSTQPAETPTRVEAMRAKIKADGHASPYRPRKQLPEPVFGQIKQARGLRQFLLRGFEKVCAEWALICTAHNLLKLANSRILSVALRLAVAAG
jgi:Transposase DDE domain/UvrD/REP helicase N-terminal domain